METLKSLGFTHCFYVGGGNSMHLLESASHRFKCVPVVHEVTAAIAAEYFNQSNDNGEKAFALVTAGPGFTNLVTGVGGAWLDSRELLVIGGQAKSTNLAKGTVRQLGHQEIDGVAIASPISKKSVRIEHAWQSNQIMEVVSQSWMDRPGPVFVEVCLDVSAQEFTSELGFEDRVSDIQSSSIEINEDFILRDLVRASQRPLVLLGGGVSRREAKAFLEGAKKFSLPVACTWTGADRVGNDYEFYAGRPNTYGMRWSNIFQQQADLLIAVGTSLGFQQTGFNIEEFLPAGNLVHVDIDQYELEKKNPKKRHGILMDGDVFLKGLNTLLEMEKKDFSFWASFLRELKEVVPPIEDCQKSRAPFVSPHEVMARIGNYLQENDCLVAASSGGTFTASMQVLSISGNQVLIGNKGLASMGYGLGGAIGCCFSRPKDKTILFEGDGGFAQNMQDLGTVRANNLNLKVFITSNDGYASIRTSQKNYFAGHYLGCDILTGLFLPDWRKIAEAFEIPALKISGSEWENDEFRILISSNGPAIFIIESDPDQMYLPKIFSRVSVNGQMSSTAIHDMSPPLGAEASKLVFRYIEAPVT